MKFLSFLISAVLILAISVESKRLTEELESIMVELAVKHQEKCQGNLNSKSTILDAFTGSLNEDEACLMECIVQKIMQDIMTNADLKMKFQKIEEEMKDYCNNKGDCEELNKHKKMEECMGLRATKYDNCAFGEKMVECMKETDPEGTEEIKKLLS